MENTSVGALEKQRKGHCCLFVCIYAKETIVLVGVASRSEEKTW